MLDYIIVGQGLSGSILSHALMDRSKSFSVIDPGHINASSVVAAGIINPITGRSYVKSWMFDTLLKDALESYKRLEDKLGISLISQRNIIRPLEDVRSENNWLTRSADEGYQKYITELDLPENFEEYYYPSFSYGEITNSYQLDINTLLNKTKSLLGDRLIEEFFEYEKLEIYDDHISYKDQKARRIIFCEGFQARNNPWFNQLDFRPSKGEVLLLKIDDYQIEKLVRNKLFICPYQDGLYWVGAAYINQFEHCQPTKNERFRLESQLKEILKSSFTIVDHLAGIRPATKHRKPMIGPHPTFNRLFIFNGMGAKGSSLIPYWSKRLINFIEEGIELSSEVKLVFKNTD